MSAGKIFDGCPAVLPGKRGRRRYGSFVTVVLVVVILLHRLSLRVSCELVNQEGFDPFPSLECPAVNMRMELLCLVRNSDIVCTVVEG